MCLCFKTSLIVASPVNTTDGTFLLALVLSTLGVKSRDLHVFLFFFISIFFLGDQPRICLFKIEKEAQIMLVICLF